jgi:cell division protein FtsW (lipid II flippase)
VLGTLLFLGGAYGAFLAFSHVQVRVQAWLDPFADFDRNYQVIQGQFGMAWGGFFGTGWGLGRPMLTPLAKTDFISAAIGEELGVAGLTAVILLYGFIVAGKLLAAGLSFVFALQVFAIIGGVTRLLPLTGLTTPFMSQGGSSLVANWIMVALLLVITHQVRRPQAPSAAEPVQSLAEEATQVIDTAAVAAARPAGPSAGPGPRPAPPDEITEPVPRTGDAR